MSFIILGEILSHPLSLQILYVHHSVQSLFLMKPRKDLFSLPSTFLSLSFLPSSIFSLCWVPSDFSISIFSCLTYCLTQLLEFPIPTIYFFIPWTVFISLALCGSVLSHSFYFKVKLISLISLFLSISLISLNIWNTHFIFLFADLYLKYVYSVVICRMNFIFKPKVRKPRDFYISFLLYWESKPTWLRISILSLWYRLFSFFFSFLFFFFWMPVFGSIGFL